MEGDLLTDIEGGNDLTIQELVLMHSDLPMQHILDFLRYSEMLVALMNKAILAQVRKGKKKTERGRKIPPQRKSSFLCSGPLTGYAVEMGLLEPDVDLMRLAAKHGPLASVQVLRGLNPPCPWDESTCAGAARNSHLARGPVLQWLRSQDPPCPWNEETCTAAAQNGHLPVLQWVRSQDPPCPWNEKTCERAASVGHLPVLQWLRSQDPSCP